jgi:hypothetical protein
VNRSRSETLEAVAGIVAAIIGVVVVSLAPSDLRPFAIVVLVVVYFLAYLLRGYFNRSSR